MTVPRVGSFHPSPDATKALDGLMRVIRRAEGIGLLVGPTGTGKSLLLSCLRERIEGDYAVALLSGARICTRRGLWQSILSDLGEAYRGLDEEELRIGLVDRIRGLAATGSGLVVLVDESHTLPRRLLEELRLLNGVVTAYPAVHLVLAGTIRLEEMLGESDLEGIAQRIAVRGYLEPLDYEETCRYVRTQMYCAGLNWDSKFEPECDGVVYSLTEGVPRLINQLCDQAIRLAEQRDAGEVGKHDLAAAWEEIQNLPAPASLRSEISGVDMPEQSNATMPSTTDQLEAPGPEFDAVEETYFGDEAEPAVIEFGALEEDEFQHDERIDQEAEGESPTLAFSECSADEHGETPVMNKKQRGREELPSSIGFEDSRRATEFAVEALIKEAQRGLNNFPSASEVSAESPSVQNDKLCVASDDKLCVGSDIELVFDPPFDSEDEARRPDPFAECFAEEEDVVERFVMEGPDDFHRHLHVASREGRFMARQLSEIAHSVPAEPEQGSDCVEDLHASQAATSLENKVATAGGDESEPDDSDMVIIEEDHYADAQSNNPTVAAVRLSDYSRLFARLRRGGQMKSSN
ncbi:MAG: AAA family ATPase [Planctomycetaceae bacterium]|nr:AAA family ATPase [Planctomycetaceae bacterium]